MVKTFLRKYLDDDKYQNDINKNLLGYYLYRGIANLITPFIIKLKIKANYITLTSILLSICMVSVAFYDKNDSVYLPVSIMALIWYILDHLDGNVARVQGGTLLGKYLDSLAGVVFIISFYLSVGMITETDGFNGVFWMVASVFIELIRQRLSLYYKHYLQPNIPAKVTLNIYANSPGLIKRVFISVAVIFPVLLLSLGILQELRFLVFIILLYTSAGLLQTQYKVIRSLMTEI